MKNTLITFLAIVSLFFALSCQTKKKQEPSLASNKTQRTTPAKIKQQIKINEERDQENEETITADNFIVGQSVSALRFFPLSGGKQQNLKEILHGRGAVIDFWSTWCRPCVLMLPDMQKAHEKLHKKTAIISISLDPSQDAAIKKMKESGCTFPALTAQSDLINSGIILPQTVIINPQGIVTFVGHGRHTFQEIIEMANKYSR